MSRPKPIRRADGTEIIGAEDSDDALIERIVDQLTKQNVQPERKRKCQVRIQTDERQTVRSFVRIDEKEESIGSTWEMLKEDIVKELQGKVDKQTFSEDLSGIDISKYPAGGWPKNENPGAVRRV